MKTVTEASGVWLSEARRQLIDCWTGHGWSYRAGGETQVEPTVLGCLALASTSGSSEYPRELYDAASWLGSIQQSDGALGLSSSVARPCWPTSYGILLWNVVGGFDACGERAIHWLLRERGKTLAPSNAQPVGHDTTLVGWPWVDNTHSWVEPTALAIMALRACGYRSHPRVAEGIRLIQDRAVASGGWNYGNKSLFGSELRARPAPTGLALVALAGFVPRNGVVQSAADYLEALLPQVHAPASLAWGLLGLRAWSICLPNADSLLQRSFELGLRSRIPSMLYSYLLLAAGVRTLEFLGCNTGYIPEGTDHERVSPGLES